MLLANFFTAERLITHVQDRAFLRNHPKPSVKNLLKLSEKLGKVGVDIGSGGNTQDLQKAFKEMNTGHAQYPKDLWEESLGCASVSQANQVMLEILSEMLKG